MWEFQEHNGLYDSASVTGAENARGSGSWCIENYDLGYFGSSAISTTVPTTACAVAQGAQREMWRGQAGLPQKVLIETLYAAPPTAPPKAPSAAPPTAPLKTPPAAPLKTPPAAPSKAPTTAPLKTPPAAPPQAPPAAPPQVPTQATHSLTCHCTSRCSSCRYCARRKNQDTPSE